MQTPIIETERIILRPLELSFADDMFNNWTSDPEATKYVMFTTQTSVEETKDFVRMVEADHESDNSYNWGFLLKETGEIFGSGGIEFSEERKMYVLGYIIRKSMWNKGLTTEAAKAMIDFAVNEAGITKIFSNHAKENIYSGKVLEKVGFVYQQDGTLTSIDGKRTYESREYLLLV